MSKIQSALNKVYRLAYRILQTPNEIKRLQQSSNPNAAKLGRALNAMLNDTLTANQAKAIEQIEGLRAELSISQEPLQVIDFGAGKSNTLTDDLASSGVMLTRTVAEMSKSSRTPIWGRLLYELVRVYQPRVAIELGTCMGISAAYQANALKLNGSGHLFTLEGAPSLADLSRKHLTRLGLPQVTVVTGRFQDTLEDVMRQNQPLDLIFIDGHHTEQATIQYFEMALPYFAPNAVAVFDDIAWSDGMKRAWQTVSSHERVEVAVDLIHLGICVVAPQKVTVPVIRSTVILN